MPPPATLLMLILFSPTLLADTGYPTNPQQVSSAIVMSHQGISAYDPLTLKMRWSSLANLHTDEPTQAPGMLLVGSSDGLFSLSSITGGVRWRFGPGRRLFSPTISGDLAYTTGIDGTLYTLSLGSGHLIRQQKISEGWIYPPAIIGGLLITGGEDGTVRAIEAATGVLRWLRPLGQELVYRPVAGPSGSVIITTFEGRVFVIDGLNGEVRLQRQDPVASFSPVVDEERIYLTGYDNQLRVLDGISGELLWTKTLPGRPVVSPQIHSKCLLVTSGEGNYLLLNKHSGATLDQGRSSTSSLGALVLNDQRMVFFQSHGKIPTTRPVFSCNNPT
ncbi:MAG: PQQ-binding-like beta-propeller repeat protein [Sedimenticola sp.]